MNKTKEYEIKHAGSREHICDYSGLSHKNAIRNYIMEMFEVGLIGLECKNLIIKDMGLSVINPDHHYIEVVIEHRKHGRLPYQFLTKVRRGERDD